MFLPQHFLEYGIFFITHHSYNVLLELAFSSLTLGCLCILTNYSLSPFVNANFFLFFCFFVFFFSSLRIRDLSFINTLSFSVNYFKTFETRPTTSSYIKLTPVCHCPYHLNMIISHRFFIIFIDGQLLQSTPFAWMVLRDSHNIS